MVYGMLGDDDQAKEMTQQAFVRAWEGLDRFKGNSLFFSWVYRIAMNQTLSHLRQKSRLVSDYEARHLASDQQNAEEAMIKEEENTALHRAIEKLDEIYRQVILLKYFEKLSYAEMAEKLEITEKKVKSRLYDARRLLRDLLNDTKT